MKNIKNIGLNISLMIAALLVCTGVYAQSTVNLTNHEPTTTPTGTTVKWYTDANHTTAVTDKTAVGPGLYYAFLVDPTNTCFQGPATLRVVQNKCSATTADITTAAPTTGIPTGATVTYHSALEPNSTNEITAADAKTRPAGTYYLAYRTGTAGSYCYSQGSPVVVIIQECPKAKNDIAQTPQDTPVSGNVLTNDTNITKVTSVTVGGVTTAVPATGTVDVAVTGGTLKIASDGSYTFTPTAGFTGSVPTITYEGEDANGVKDTATLDIDVIPTPSSTTNAAPVANDDTNTVKQGGTVTTNVLANDNDPDGNTLSVKPSSMTGLSATGMTVVLTSTPQDVYDANGNKAGQASIDASGNLVFTADANYTGDVPFNYTAQDGKGGESTAKAVITVTPSTSPNSTVANDDASLGEKGKPQSGNVLTNDSDPEGNTQTVKEIKVIDASGNEVTVTAGTATDVYVKNADGSVTKAGSLTVNSDGTYSYTPEPNYVGTVPVKVVVQDNNGTPATATSTLSLTTTEKAPRNAKNDIAQTTKDQPVSGNVLKNDENLTKVTKVTIGGVETTVPAGTTGATVNIPGKGTLVIKEDGSFTFTPATGYTGDVPPITYTGTTASGQEATADLTIKIAPEPVTGNNPPIANDDTNTVKSGGTVKTKVLANDSDIDGDPVTIKSGSTTGLNSTGQPVVLSTNSASPTTVYDANGVEAGTAYVDETIGEVVFTAKTGYTGDVPFSYTAQDGKGGESTAKLNVTVIPSDAPNTTVANDDAALVKQGETATGNVITNDTDPESNTQTVKEIKVLDVNGNEVTVAAGTATDVYVKNTDGSTTKAGNLTVNSDGTYSYVAEASFVGTPPVEVVVQDNNASQALATSALNLTTVNSSVLPVTLSRFYGVVRLDKAFLTWTTASELNNWKFEVERSIDGRSFDKIGEVDGNGTTSVSKDYSYVDGELPNATLVYYRLKQIDYDGQYEYSPVVVLNGGASPIRIYPNPVVAQRNIGIYHTSDTDRYEIYDMLGGIVQAGICTQRVDVSALIRGTYIIRILDVNNRVKHIDKLIK